MSIDAKVYKDLRQVEKLASLEDRSLVGPPLVERLGCLVEHLVGRRLVGGSPLVG